MLGAILGAVAGPIIGSIFNKKEKKKERKNYLADREHAEAQYEENKILDYKKLVKESSAAGFNPLTALMYGSGSGYSGGVGPQSPSGLSSGSFISEAISRGADTYFSTVAARDQEATNLRREAEDKRRWEAEMALRTPVGSFGYSLQDEKPYNPARTATLPALASNPAPSNSTGRPPIHPFRQDQSFIPIRLPNGTPGQIDASIARRMDIAPWDTVSAGDYVELVGELVGEAETVGYQLPIRDTVLNARGQGVTYGVYGDTKYKAPAFTGSPPSLWDQVGMPPQYQ